MRVTVVCPVTVAPRVIVVPLVTETTPVSVMIKRNYIGGSVDYPLALLLTASVQCHVKFSQTQHAVVSSTTYHLMAPERLTVAPPEVVAVRESAMIVPEPVRSSPQVRVKAPPEVVTA